MPLASCQEPLASHELIARITRRQACQSEPHKIVQNVTCSASPRAKTPTPRDARRRRRRGGNQLPWPRRSRGQRSSRRPHGGMPARRGAGRRDGLRAALALARRGRRGCRGGNSARSPRPAQATTARAGRRALRALRRRPRGGLFTRPRRRDGRPRGAGLAPRGGGPGRRPLPAGRGRRRARRHVRRHRERFCRNRRRGAGPRPPQAPSVVEPLRESIRPLRCTSPQPALAEGWTPRGASRRRTSSANASGP